MMKDIQKANKSGIMEVTLALPGELRQMQRQGSVGPQQPHKMHQQPGGPSLSTGFKGRQGGRGEGQGGLLPQAHGFVCRPGGPAQTGAVPVEGFQPAQGMEKAKPPGFGFQSLQQG